MNARFLPLLALGLLPILPACLVQSESRTTFSGETVAPEAAHQIVEGCTQEFVKGLIGPPTAETELPDGGSLWKWTSSRSTAKGGRVFLLFSSTDVTEVEADFFVEFREGLVTRSWRQGA